GTFLGDARVDQAEWDGTVPLRIAPFELHLVREGTAIAQPTPRPKADRPPAAPLPPWRREGAIEVELRPRTETRAREAQEQDAAREMEFPRSILKGPMVSAAGLHASGYPVGECEYLAVGGGLGSFVWVDHLRCYGVPASAIRVAGDMNWNLD